MRPGILSMAAGLLWLPFGVVQAADWQIESVEPAGVPVKYTSMKIDSLGNVHIAYAVDDGNRYPLRYALWDHTLRRWFTMTVDQNIGTCSLALDSAQHPHISYTDFAGGRLRYAHWDGANWKTEVLPVNSQNVNYYQSIAISPDDRPTIAFYEYEGPKGTDIRIRLRAVMWNGKFWELRTIDSDQGSGKFNAMVSDPLGHLHLAYANVSAGTGGIRYAFWNGQSWDLEILEGERQNNGHGVGWSCNVAVDKNNLPHFTYVDETDRLVKYAVRSGGRWRIQVIDKIAGVAYPDRNSIAIAEDGRPYVGYFDGGSGILQIAHPEGQRWAKETVDSNGSGYTSSMQIDRGVLWISYADTLTGGLKVARRELGTGVAAELNMANSAVKK
jgi:hypothetical protein